MAKITHLFLSFLLIFCNIAVILRGTPAAASAAPVVISHVLAGEDGAATSESIALFNNSSQDIELTGYCLKNKSNIKFACITGESGVQVFIKAREYLTVSSTVYVTKHGYHPDTAYTVTHQTSGSIVASGDTITLLNPADQDVDVVTWSGGLATGATWIRKETAPGSKVLMDTNGPSDFVASSDPERVFPANTSYDVEPLVDLCSNLVGAQLEVPTGYRIDGSDCVLDLVPLQLTELLPNADGADTGKEFIELYNPTDRVVNLDIYKLRVETDSVKTYSFPGESHINPGEYAIFYDVQMKFTLANTAGKVSLIGSDGTLVNQADQYTQPTEEEAWAFIDGHWQYTNQPTPGAANSLSVEEEEGNSTASSPTPCPEGKYRHPLTGRCRNIDSDASVLATCEADQYRNPETGRCRKLASPTTLAPCKEDQYRSEETNRCRNIVVSAALASCKEGQERNADTNRCRNVAASMPAAGFAVEPIKQGAQAFVGWWALGAVGALALGYAVWEWRYEIMKRIRSIHIPTKIK